MQIAGQILFMDVTIMHDYYVCRFNYLRMFKSCDDKTIQPSNKYSSLFTSHFYSIISNFFLRYHETTNEYRLYLMTRFNEAS